MGQSELKHGAMVQRLPWHHLPVPPLDVGSSPRSFLAHVSTRRTPQLGFGFGAGVCSLSLDWHLQQWATAFNQSLGTGPPSWVLSGHHPIPFTVQAHLFHLSPWGRQL